MEPFDLERFALIALAEALFYDEEYGAMGTVSLINEVLGREVYIASYDPEEDVFLVEEATDWEALLPDGDDDEVGYKMAVDSKTHARCDTPYETAEVLLRLASEGNLQPSVSLMFEVDDATDD